MEPQKLSLPNRHNTPSHTHTIHMKTREVEGEEMYERLYLCENEEVPPIRSFLFQFWKRERKSRHFI